LRIATRRDDILPVYVSRVARAVASAEEQTMSDALRFDDYTIDLEREDDGSWVAEVVEMPGCLAAGEDPTDAVAMLRGPFGLWIEDARERGIAVPPPLSTGPNGRLLLRLPRSLHMRVARAAARDGVSVNAFVTAAVAERVGAGGRQAHGVG
jgi:antitoxin HicB